jgi:hypothetical protein
MAKNARRHTLLPGPAAISIHDDGDVPRNIIPVDVSWYLTVVGFHFSLCGGRAKIGFESGLRKPDFHKHFICQNAGFLAIH